MRIIAGERRGHKFDGPDDEVTRPTSDMVREAIFNILGERPEGRQVYDLFAGSGGLGLEALSRGADHALFIEKDRKNAALIRKNLTTLRLADRGGVLLADAYRWARTFVPESAEPVLVLIDPPYRDYRDPGNKVGVLIRTLLERLPDGSTLVVESEKDHERTALPDRDLWNVRRYGGTQVAVRDVEATPPPELEQGATTR